MATVQPALTWGNRQSQLHVVARPDGLLEIVLGLHCIEVVPRDAGSVQYRMAMGRLVNAGWEVTALGERLGHDTRTLRGWAEALLCTDPAAMLRGLSGRGADGKVTAEIVEFVLDWWDELCVRARSFRTRILSEGGAGVQGAGQLGGVASGPSGPSAGQSRSGACERRRGRLPGDGLRGLGQRRGRTRRQPATRGRSGRGGAGRSPGGRGGGEPLRERL